jgi:uncharacterized protein YijF (DUF1287 family)
MGEALIFCNAGVPPAVVRSSRPHFFPLIVGILLFATSVQPQKLTTAQRFAFTKKLVAAANERPQHKVRYDGAYVHLAYPGGDVPADTGTCTDEIIRIYRAVGIDLQKDVHQDMQAHFSVYPRKWGQSRSNGDIDHRRVPNLMTFFRRNGEVLPMTQNASDYGPGDLVTYDLGGGQTHIAIVVDHQFGLLQKRYGIVHNIGAGPKLEDNIFSYKIIGHYRYFGMNR